MQCVWYGLVYFLILGLALFVFGLLGCCVAGVWVWFGWGLCFFVVVWGLASSFVVWFLGFVLVVLCFVFYRLFVSLGLAYLYVFTNTVFFVCFV